MTFEMRKGDTHPAALFSNEPFYVTVLSWGAEGKNTKRDQTQAGKRRADFLKALRVQWTFNERPNGLRRYLARFDGLPVVRLRLTEGGPVFVTPSGVVLRVTTANAAFPLDLVAQAEEAGLLPKPSKARSVAGLEIDTNLSEGLSRHMRFKVVVYVTPAGSYIIASSSRLDENEKLVARLWLTNASGKDAETIDPE